MKKKTWEILIEGKTNKTLIKGLKLNIKNKEDSRVLFLVGERKDGDKEEMTIGDKPHIISCHTPYKKELDTVELPNTWWKVKLVYLVMSHTPSKSKTIKISFMTLEIT